VEYPLCTPIQEITSEIVTIYDLEAEGMHVMDAIKTAVQSSDSDHPAELIEIGQILNQSQVVITLEKLMKAVGRLKDLAENLSIHLEPFVKGIDQYKLWYCNSKELEPSNRPLSDYFGRNEKVRIKVKLQRASEGVPIRESPIDAETHKQMLSYYYKRQEQLNRLDNPSDDEDSHYLDSQWSNPKQLKNSLIGNNGIINFKF